MNGAGLHCDDGATLRYAKCWEDADILLEALDIHSGDTCLSIASGGDNTFSLLTRAPKQVIAIDFSPAQIACLELRMAAYRALEHCEMLELMGERDSERRWCLYLRARRTLSDGAQAFWDSRPGAILAGIGTAGRFERYLSLFRRFVLPLIHSQSRVRALFVDRPREERVRFYEERWDSLRWRVVLAAFFSRAVSSRLGRDPRFFRYVRGDVGARALDRVRWAMTDLAPHCNPYLSWMALGRHGAVLPHALRPENFDLIRHNLDRIELRTATLGAFLDEAQARSIDRFNLSDVFEYMSEREADRHYAAIARVGRSGGRLAYWNAYVRRRRPDFMADKLYPLTELADSLHRLDKAFIYESFVIEQIA